MLTRNDGNDKTWHQSYLNALIKSELSYHSNIAWKLFSNNFYFTINELCLTKSTLGDLAIKNYIYEATMTLSIFGHISKGHTTHDF